MWKPLGGQNADILANSYRIVLIRRSKQTREYILKLQLVFVLSFSLLSNAFGAIASANKIQSIVDEASYKLSQLDSLKGKESQKVFEEVKLKLQELRASGLSQKEILSGLKDLSNNPMTSKEIDLLIVETQVNQIPESEFFNFISKKIEDIQATGSNYVGNVSIAISVVLVILIVVLIANGESCEDQGLETVQECDWWYSHTTFDYEYLCRTYCI